MKDCWEVQSHSLLVVIVPNEPSGAGELEGGMRPRLSPRMAQGPLQAQQGQPGAKARGGDCQKQSPDMAETRAHGHTATSDLPWTALKTGVSCKSGPYLYQRQEMERKTLQGFICTH